MGNARLIIMFVMALVVAGSMYGILANFLRRLRKIQDDFWSQKPEKVKPAAPEPAKPK